MLLAGLLSRSSKSKDIIYIIKGKILNKMDNGKALARGLQNHSPSQRRRDFTMDISDLPADVLIQILSELSIKEAMRASTLSSKWKNLWWFVTRSLNITLPEKIRGLQRTSSGFHGKLAIEIYWHIMWVNKVMGLHSAPYVDELSIVALLNEKVFKHVDGWIEFASKKGIQKFELDFGYCSDNLNESYSFPSIKWFVQLRGSVDATSSRCCLRKSINEDHCSGIFCCLKSLSLKNVNISNEILEYLMSNCRFLEQICVEKSKDLVNLKVTGCRLKHFQIIKCFNLKILEILADNIMSFLYIGPKIDVPFRSVPSRLKKLTIGGQYVGSFVSEPDDHRIYLSLLESLKLMIPRTVDDAISSSGFQLNRMINLKHLELHVPPTHHETLPSYLGFINKAPFLSTFKMKYDVEGPLPQMIQYKRGYELCRHFQLREVEFVGYLGGVADYHLIHRILAAAAFLDRLVLQFEKIEFVNGVNVRRVGSMEDLWREELPFGAELVVKFNDVVLSHYRKD
ncbi:hypothetical protein M9H77_33067 [Catharanthus roseus]|uniref:Uncharacterized protein n=1 Tax=Catharanthus roseus TaxID=4058 RepID=A0ACC0A6K4_CATRO|nr:hypothetical protein M9H77_33067 [Catharanthus roseus]